MRATESFKEKELIEVAGHWKGHDPLQAEEYGLKQK